jgi:hypothetical protein
MEYSLLYRWTPERRQLDYLRWVGASDDTAKEVQLFGLAGWLTERYRVLSERWYRENRKLATRKALVSSALSFIGTCGYYAAYVVIIARAVAGAHHARLAHVSRGVVLARSAISFSGSCSARAPSTSKGSTCATCSCSSR